MSTTPPAPPPEPALPARSRAVAARALGSLVLIAGLLSACALGAAPSPGDGETLAPVRRSQAVDGISRILRVRSRAVRQEDATRFLQTVAQADPQLVRDQRQYFDNLRQLPVGVFRQRLVARSLERTDSGYRALVRTSLMLKGFDTRPVVRPALVAFQRDREGKWRLASARDTAWEEAAASDLQPWDHGPIATALGDGVLGIFDEASQAVSTEVVAAVEAGIDDVSAVIPYDWGRAVVVYALSDTSMLEGIDNLPGDLGALDAVAFPVLARRGEPEIAGTRFLLHPRMLDSEPATLARLVRHELTHVALGLRDDQAPVWFAEGLAEWVSVQPLAPADRVVSGAALAAARAGEVVMPDDASFNGADSAVNYGLAWWACQTIVDMYGESMLWSLLDSYVGTPRERHAAVLEDAIGLDADALAAEAARRIIATYG